MKAIYPTIGFVVALFCAGGLFAQQTRTIGGLIGRADNSLNLYVRAAAAGAAGQSAAIGNLTGRTDANLNLYVVFDPTVPNIMGGASLSGASLTAGSGVGVTVNDTGSVRRQVYKVTVTSAAFIAAAVTSDVVIATMPAKTIVLGVYGDLTTVFACGSVCTTSTLSIMLGTSAGDSRFLAAGLDVDAATTVFGDADAELGGLMVRAAAVQGGYLGSMNSTSPMTLRLTSGTGNIGTGAATNLSQGTLTLYIIAEILP